MIGTGTRKVLAYSTLPGLWPRTRELFFSGFGYISLFTAIIYYNVGLLPVGHPALDHRNFGRVSLRRVIADAMDHLVFSRENIDKIIIFFTIIIGLVMLLMQFILMGFSLVSIPVFAATWTDTFVDTPEGPSQDIALIVLDRVFGVIDIFNSCYSTAVDCLNLQNDVVYKPAVYPSPFHTALHDLFAFYSFGIITVSIVIILYFLMAIVGETAVSGTPFGRRFNKAWALPRLLVFFALIVPFGDGANNPGLNGAQYITLGVAKFGSNMATNAWDTLNLGIIDAYAADEVTTLFGDKGSLIAYPTVPSVGKLNQFMYLVRMCMYAERILNNKDVRPYIVRENKPDTLDPETLQINDWLPYLDDLVKSPPTFQEAVEFSRYGQVVLRFGEQNLPDPDPLLKGSYAKEWGFVEPTCGEITFDFVSTDPYVIGDGAYGIQENYYESIREYLLYDPTYDTAAYCMVRAIIPFDHDPACVDTPAFHDFNDADMWGSHGPGAYPGLNTNTEWLTAELAKSSVNYYDTVNQYYINGNFSVGNTVYSGTASAEFGASIIGMMRADYDFAIPPEVLRLGWVGMAAYYQQIANVNGMIFSAVQSVPSISKYPKVLEIIGAQHDAEDINPKLEERFNPLLQNGKLAELPRPGDHYLAAALYSGYRFWDQTSAAEGNNKKKSDNVIIDTINALFGTEGLFNMLNNNDVHPLAQLSALGKSILESSIRNIFMGSAVGLVSDILNKKFKVNVGALPKVAGTFVSKIGMLGLVIGFMLYYVLPLLPFIFFFFAFGGWVKAIFEAMVAMPLWALAHIKIDGNGLPGPMATNGYFLLFEIFLRPTMIVFGFLASITIFAASVTALNQIYETVAANVGGFSLKENIYKGPVAGGMGGSTIEMLRGPLDQLMYTVIYAVIVYMMAMSSFKLIDQVPRTIMRWAGSVVSTFQERSDPQSELVGRMSRTANITKAQLNSAIDRIKGTVSSSVTQDELNRMNAYNKPK